MAKKAKSKKPRAKKAIKSLKPRKSAPKKVGKTKKRAPRSAAPQNGSPVQNGIASNGHAQHAPTEDDHVLTVTFRIPTSLKRSVEETAKGRGMTTTRLVVEALTNEVGDCPPRWFSNWQLSREKR